MGSFGPIAVFYCIFFLFIHPSSTSSSSLWLIVSSPSFLFPALLLGCGPMRKMPPLQRWPQLCGEMSRRVAGRQQLHLQICQSQQRVSPLPRQLHPGVRVEGYMKICLRSLNLQPLLLCVWRQPSRHAALRSLPPQGEKQRVCYVSWPGGAFLSGTDCVDPKGAKTDRLWMKGQVKTYSRGMGDVKPAVVSAGEMIKQTKRKSSR